jgi:hypothetical protein
MKKHYWLQNVVKDIIYYCQMNNLHDVSVHMRIIEFLLDDVMCRGPSEFRPLDRQEATVLETSGQNVITFHTPTRSLDSGDRVKSSLD